MGGTKHFWINKGTASVARKAVISPWHSDFAIRSIIGCRQYSELTLDTTGISGQGFTITLGNGTNSGDNLGGITREGLVTICGKGTVVCNYDATALNSNAAQTVNPFFVAEPATLSLATGANLGTGAVTVGLGATLATSGGGAKVGALELGGGSTLSVGGLGPSTVPLSVASLTLPGMSGKVKLTVPSGAVPLGRFPLVKAASAFANPADVAGAFDAGGLGAVSVEGDTVYLDTTSYTGKCYRFVVDAPMGDGSCMQLSDVALVDADGRDIPASAFTLAYDGTTTGFNGNLFGGGETPDKAVDGDHSTKWLDFRAGRDVAPEARAAAYVDFRLENPVAVFGYRWYTAGDNNLYQGRRPVSWRLLSSDDGGATWTTLDAVADYDTTTESQALAYEKYFGYSRVKFRVDGIRTPSKGEMQFSDLAVFDMSGTRLLPDVDFVLACDTNIVNGKIYKSGTNGWHEEPDKAVDVAADGSGRLDTKWLDPRPAECWWVELNTFAPAKVSGYRWSTANDAPDRDPVSWTLLGSNDGVNWDVIDQVVDANIPTDRQVAAFSNEVVALVFRESDIVELSGGGSATLTQSQADWLNSLGAHLDVETALKGVGEAEFGEAHVLNLDIMQPGWTNWTFSATAMTVAGADGDGTSVRIVATLSREHAVKTGGGQDARINGTLRLYAVSLDDGAEALVELVNGDTLDNAFFDPDAGASAGDPASATFEFRSAAPARFYRVKVE